ncbi:hypothetical protein Tco_0493475 [Tanacetum coccineum]
MHPRPIMDYLNPSTSPPPRVSSLPPTQDNASMDITLTLSPNTLTDVQFDTPSPSPPIIAHPILGYFLKAHATTAAIVFAVYQANDHGFGGIWVPKQKRNTGIESYELMIDLQSIRDPESINF